MENKEKEDKERPQ